MIHIKIFSNGTFVLSTAFAEDSGIYGCVATSPSATVREEAYLSVITKDGEWIVSLIPKLPSFVVAFRIKNQ